MTGQRVRRTLARDDLGFEAVTTGGAGPGKPAGPAESEAMLGGAVEGLDVVENLTPWCVELSGEEDAKQAAILECRGVDADHPGLAVRRDDRPVCDRMRVPRAPDPRPTP